MRIATRAALFAVLATAFACTSAAGQTIPINHVETHVFVGDSIAGGTFPFYTTLAADMHMHSVGVTTTTSSATSSHSSAASSSTSAAMGGTAYSSTYQAFSNSGQNIEGIRSAQNIWLTAGVSAGATIYWVEGGVNNVSGANKDVAGAQASSLQLIADIHAAAPSAKVVWINILAGISEQVPAATDADVATVDGYCASACAANPTFCYYVDIHTAQQAYETAHNTPLPGAVSGVLTLDGTHPNATGLQLYTTKIESQIVYQ